ncbi:HAD-IIB family hydrolase [Pseudolactococcus reticulitermitis]|uniref:Hydrolase n=1 Tax=Pseudolactococcus reticulitermitis TaxID=2025039 RepID=A0A224WZV6_9LACT|nr:HAD-IIB family hydrolase [Lactococcus reticulitermitis]GAX47569.1 hypothetical protein RsY01_1169 [Lactococcus reticulitermitis]
MDILVFDLDGTIVFDGIQIKPDLLAILKALNQRYEIIFASARPIRDMLPLLPDFPDNDLIGGNGSMIRQKGCIEVTARIDATSARQIMTEIVAEKLDYIIDYDWDYTAKVAANHSIWQKLDTNHLAQNIPLQFDNISKIITFETPEKFSLLFPDALYHADVQELVFTGKNINKYTTLKTLIGDCPYTTFGNDHNDIDLLNHAETAFQIGNQDLPVTSKNISEEQLPQILHNL